MSAVVAHYIHRYLPLTEQWIGDQLRFIRSYRSIVLTSHRTDVTGQAVFSTDACATPLRLWNDALRRLRHAAPLHEKACRREGAAVVHAHFGDRATEVSGVAERLGIPLVVSFYGRDMWRSDRGDDLRRRYKSLFAAGDLFVVEGPAARQRLIDVGCPAGKTFEHRLGVDVAAIPFVPRAVQNSGEPIRVLMAARFVEKKGLEYGLRAFCAVAEGEPRLTLMIVGDAGRSRQEQEIKARLHALASASTAAERIRFTGFLSKEELMRLAYEHHILLHPSVTAADGDAEGGHPVVMTELAASGMPTIATHHCDIPQIVIDGVTGYLAAERDIDALAGALRRYLQAPEQIAEFGQRAREHVAARYDGRQTTLDSVYDEVLARRRAT